MRTRHSIRFQLAIYLLLCMMVCILIMALSNLQVSKLINDSSSLFQCNQELSDFYSTVDRMDYAAREYVYSRSDEYYLQYQKYDETARAHLLYCRRNLDEKTEKRFLRLAYMLDYYAEILEQYIRGDKGQYEAYMLLRYRSDLISGTSTKYYGYLAASMSERAQEMQRQWSDRRLILAAASALIVLAGFFLERYYRNSICGPIQIMVKNTVKLRNEEYELESPHASLKELVVLEKAFEDMSARIKEDIETLRENARLEQELLRQENENLQMKNLMTETELRNLQSQINPHFLFNTMNMISKSAFLNEDIQTSELMNKLSAFLRYALDKADKTSTLREEIESIRNYIYIQKKRFGNRVKFVVEIPEDIPNISMPAVTIQPLIENAIIHGIGSMIEEAEIAIKAVVDEEFLTLHIEDNGIGMDAEQLEELQVYLHRILVDPVPCYVKPGIGLANVYKRLHVYYGEGLEFSVESEAECGTIVMIRIPEEVWNEQ